MQVKPFTDGETDSENAKAILAVARHLLSTRESFTDKDVSDIIFRETNVNLEEHYPGTKWSYSPPHKGLYALSKTIKNEEGIDKFARGEAMILKKQGKCGLKSGVYTKNLDKYFTPVDEEELKQACWTLVMNSSAGKQLRTS